MSGNIYWLASYPKSGNTWLRVLLTNYLRNSDTPASINNLNSGPIASGRQVFDENIGVETSDLTQEEIERYRPYVYEKISTDAQGPVFLKIHDAYTKTCEGKPIVTAAATAGVVYLIRNPLDVSVSFSHHGGASLAKTVARMGDPDFQFVDNPERLHKQLRQRLLGWSGHVRSWTEQSCLPILVLRYEDMIADPIAAFIEVAQFCGLEVDPVRISRAVEFSTFDRLKTQEQKYGFGEKLPGSACFFRKGLSGSWADELDAYLVEQLVLDHGTVMRKFNYPIQLPADAKRFPHYRTNRQ